MIPPYTPVIIIYDSAVVHSHHLFLLSDTTIQCRLTCTVFPSIIKSLSHRLQQVIIHHALPSSHPIDVTTQPLIDTFLQTLTSLNINNSAWDNTLRIFHIGPSPKSKSNPTNLLRLATFAPPINHHPASP